MADHPVDPLLLVAKGLIYFLLAVIGFATVIVAVCVPGVLFIGPEFAGEIAAGEISTLETALIALFLALVAGLLALSWRFFWLMLGIARSVAQGDPFVRENATRLSTMAWIALAINALYLPVAGFAVYLASRLKEHPGTIDATIDFGGLILVLTLFILARVFRHGAAMREDLEGTV